MSDQYLSHLVDYIEMKFQRLIPYFRSLETKTPCATGSHQSNMAAAKPEVVKYHLVDYMESKFQRLPNCL